MTTTLLLFFNILSGLLAQWLAQGTHNPLVTGSNPVGPTKDIYTHTKKERISIWQFDEIELEK